jgi:hypothetical protein
MEKFHQGADSLPFFPELFREWFVQIKEVSTGYEKSSLGKGWYPDALIPINPYENVDRESMRDKGIYFGRFRRRMELPDLRNRVDNQQYLVIFIDQYIPLERSRALPGEYHSTVTVTAENLDLKLPVVLKIWDFALPNKNNLRANLQHGGFNHLDTVTELALYQYFRRNRIVPVNPNYRPNFKVVKGKVRFDWKKYDLRLKKYLTGEAFTKKYGYYGPGYGMPLEILMMPFNTTGGWHKRRWYYFKGPEHENSKEFRKFYIDGIKKVRKHVLSVVDTSKTQLIVFLNDLDEAYDKASYNRMVFYGRMFRDHFPEAIFRIDGSYSEKTMKKLKDVVDVWCCHSIGYNMDLIEKFRALGIQDWFYGPLLYEKWDNEWCGSMTFTDLEINHDRAAGWIAWKYRAASFCSWGIFHGWRTAWYNPETFKQYYAKGKYKKNPVMRTFNGNAQAVYSGGIINWGNLPSPTFRIKAMRDGVEEYEMLKMLADKSGNTEKADSIANTIIGFPLGKRGVGNINPWSHNPGDWDRARIELGSLLEEK